MLIRSAQNEQLPTRREVKPEGKWERGPPPIAEPVVGWPMYETRQTRTTVPANVEGIRNRKEGKRNGLDAATTSLNANRAIQPHEMTRRCALFTCI